MSEPDKTDAAPPEKKKRSKLVPLLLAVNVLVLGGGGAAAYFLLVHGGAQAHADDAPAVEPLGPLVELEPMVVNLVVVDSESTPAQYARIALQLELTSEDAREHVEPRMVPIRSSVLLYLSGLAAADLAGREAREGQLEALCDAINEVVGGEHVRRVYTTELVVQ